MGGIGGERATFPWKKEKEMSYDISLFFAEREGFEPPEPFSSTVFKTAAIDHSATSPFAGAKVEHFFEIMKENAIFL